MADQTHRTRAGFTLAELLIVVAIIGALAAVAVPVFAGTLDKTKARVCAANRAMLMRAIMYEKMLNTSDEDICGQYTTAALKEKGYVCPIHDNELRLHYNINTSVFSVSCEGSRGHRGGMADFNFGATVKDFLAPGEDLWKTLNDRWDGTGNVQRIDSSAPNNNYASDIKACLEKATNYSLGVGMSTTWSISGLSMSNGTLNNNYQVFWSGTDITKCQTGDRILVMRYNNNYRGNQTYIAAWCTVTTHTEPSVNGGKPYNVLDHGKFTTVGDDASKDFDTAYSLYLKELEKNGGTGVKPNS